MKKNLSVVNYQAYKYNESIIDTVRSICNPLDTLGVKVFGYHKIFSDGSYLSISNDLQWKKFYFENVGNSPIIWERSKVLQSVSDICDYVPYMWPSSPMSLIEKYLFEHNIWNGFQFIKHSPSCFELWAFASDVNNNRVNNLYLDHTTIFIKFIHYFNQNAKNLITITNTNDKHKLAWYDDPPVLPNLNSIINEQEIMSEFTNLIARGTIPAYKNDDNTIVYITSRQFDCLKLLTKGYTYSQIGKRINISDRTVESHINNLKIKTHTYCKSGLFEIYKKIVFFTNKKNKKFYEG